jgi:hypothetical protein
MAFYKAHYHDYVEGEFKNLEEVEAELVKRIQDHSQPLEHRWWEVTIQPSTEEEKREWSK